MFAFLRKIFARKKKLEPFEPFTSGPDNEALLLVPDTSIKNVSLSDLRSFVTTPQPAELNKINEDFWAARGMGRMLERIAPETHHSGSESGATSAPSYSPDPSPSCDPSPSYDSGPSCPSRGDW